MTLIKRTLAVIMSVIMLLGTNYKRILILFPSGPTGVTSLEPDWSGSQVVAQMVKYLPTMQETWV